MNSVDGDITYNNGNIFYRVNGEWKQANDKTHIVDEELKKFEEYLDENYSVTLDEFHDMMKTHYPEKMI